MGDKIELHKEFILDEKEVVISDVMPNEIRVIIRFYDSNTSQATYNGWCSLNAMIKKKDIGLKYDNSSLLIRFKDCYNFSFDIETA